jgi:hypothetical protein
LQRRSVADERGINALQSAARRRQSEEMFPDQSFGELMKLRAHLVVASLLAAIAFARDEETIIQVWGMGPATSTAAEEK